MPEMIDRPRSLARFDLRAPHRDLIQSTPNALASAGNYLKAYGWQRGQAWTSGSAQFRRIEEVELKKWNASEVYTKTIAYFASRLAQEP
jgi:membrane-bound lytic murein transglycosylase B